MLVSCCFSSAYFSSFCNVQLLLQLHPPINHPKQWQLFWINYSQAMMQESKAQLYVSTNTDEICSHKVHYSASKYRNNIVLIINQTGTIGSVLQGQLQSDSSDPIYDLATSFGATEDPFYEILFRRVLDVVYVDMKVIKEVKTTLIISLPLKSKEFDPKVYYEAVFEGIKREIKGVV